MGYYGGDWTYEEYKKAIKKSIIDNRKSVTLDTEHCSGSGDQQLMQWANEDGYSAVYGCDSVTVKLDG